MLAVALAVLACAASLHGVEASFSAVVQFYNDTNCSIPLLAPITVNSHCNSANDLMDDIFGFNISSYIPSSIEYMYNPVTQEGYGEAFVGVSDCNTTSILEFSLGPSDVGKCRTFEGNLNVLNILNVPYAFSLNLLSLPSAATASVLSAVVLTTALALVAALAL